jgi:hypothetical protein
VENNEELTEITISRGICSGVDKDSRELLEELVECPPLELIPSVPTLLSSANLVGAAGLKVPSQTQH